MAWTYTANPMNVPVDHIRLLIGDTDQQDPLLQDEEIAFMLEQHSNPKKAAAECCILLYARYARQVNYSIGPESVQAGERAKAFKALAKTLTDSISSGAFPTSGSSTTGIFDIGMHDNPPHRRGLRG